MITASSAGLDSALLADLRVRTTYPPVIYSNLTFSGDLLVEPSIQRDTDELDRGYHYEPVDMMAVGVSVTNGNVTVRNGAVLGHYFGNCLLLRGGSLDSRGLAQSPNRFAHYLSVQEQPLLLGATGRYTWAIVPIRTSGVIGSAQIIRTCFNRVPGGEHFDVYQSGDNQFSGWTIRDSRFAHGIWRVYEAPNGLEAVNNLLVDTLMDLADWGDWGYPTFAVNFRNNLFRRGTFTPDKFSSTTWTITDNAFDWCKVNPNDTVINHSHNAYIAPTNMGRLQPSQASDVVLTTFAYNSGALGRFYQSSTNLVNRGSRTADLASLYHYTTSTNQTKEGSSQVDIGFHYVAVNGFGTAADTDNDGVPDYLEDSNGDGSPTGDPTSWPNYNSPNGLTPSSALQVFTPLKN